jgi:uncharacterized protein (UPF0332 family)
MELIKIEKDIERAKSLYKLANLRQNKINTFNTEKESALIAEAYYEICKELITAILFCDGYKTLSHKDLIEYIKKNYKELDEYELETINTLRIKRNKIVYYGTELPPFYIKKNKETIEKIISKLQKILEKSLE